MKNFKKYCLFAVLGGSLLGASFLIDAKAQTLAGGDCEQCEDNKRRAVVACLRFGGTYENGQPAAWINFGDRFKCKVSQDSQCPGESHCQLSQQP
jgi:hypothetical protein